MQKAYPLLLREIEPRPQSHPALAAYQRRPSCFSEILVRSQLKWITISPHCYAVREPAFGTQRDAGLNFASQPFAMSNHSVEILFHSGRCSICVEPLCSRRRGAIV